MDNKELTSQLSKRKKDKWVTLFTSETCENICISSPSDLGVIRNGGRRGASIGARAILNSFSQLIAHKAENLQVVEQDLSRFDLNTFDQCQSTQIAELLKNLELPKKKIVHLGGGHDHVYPLVQAIFQKHKKKVKVLNIDAHLDTRQDEWNHSGTPFRQLMNELGENIQIYQLGIHNFSNVEKNYVTTNSSLMEVKEMDQFFDINTPKAIKDFLNQWINIKSDELLILSLDCDAITGNQMKGVSAVNPIGLTQNQLNAVVDWYNETNVETKAFGIYEYNPLYDDLSQVGSKYIASLINLFLKN